MPCALTYIATKFDLDLTRRVPIEIPNTNRDTLARLFAQVGYLRGVEVGVERGAYSEVLLRENIGLTLTCVDAWTAFDGYRDHVRQGKLDRFYVETQQRLAPYKNRVQFVRKFSVDAAKDFADGSLDFAYIDANHDFQSLTADLAAWSPKVRAGGIIAGHDYSPHRWPNRIHVMQVIHGWTDAYDIRPWFVLGSKEKVPGQLRDDARSWFWISEPRPVVSQKGPIRH